MLTKDFQLVPQNHQQVWGWPAVMVFTLGGMGAGFYVTTIIESFMRTGFIALSSPSLFGLIGVAISAIGFLNLTAETGRPSRSLYVTMNIKSAWISREIILFLLFAASAISNSFFPSVFLCIPSLLMAICFIVSQGLIIYRSLAVSAWNVPLVPALFLISGLLSGYSGILFVAILEYIPLSRNLFALGFVLLSSHLAIWLMYLFGERNEAFFSATAKLRKPLRLTAYVSISFISPLAFLLYASVSESIQSASYLLAAAGSTILVSAVVEKIELLRTVGKLRRITLKIEVGSHN